MPKTKKKVVKKVVARIDRNKEKLLQKFREMPIIQVAVAQLGITRMTYYRWCDIDREFAREADEARDEGILYMNDMMESLLVKKAKEGNLTAITTWLKTYNRMYADPSRFEYIREEMEKDEPLAPEHIEQIAKCMMAWSDPKISENERDEDYELTDEERFGVSNDEK